MDFLNQSPQSVTLGGDNKRQQDLPFSSTAATTVDASQKIENKGSKASIAPPHNITDEQAKTKYDFPVSTWLTQAFVIFVCVLFHLLAERGSDPMIVWLVNLDLLALAAILMAITLGFIIKRLNKISFRKNTKSRIWADRLCRVNGIIVSVMFAVGLLIVLVQSTIYMSS